MISEKFLFERLPWIVIGVACVLVAGGGYVALHFIAKFW